MPSPAPFSFGRGRRLRSHVEFAAAQRSGRRVVTPHFTLLVAGQSSPASSRLGLVVSSKVGIAVRRNRIKRLCREAFRTWPGLLPDGVDLIVIAKSGAHELGLAGVRAEWLAVVESLRRRASEALARRAAPSAPPGRRP